MPLNNFNNMYSRLYVTMCSNSIVMAFTFQKYYIARQPFAFAELFGNLFENSWHSSHNFRLLQNEYCENIRHESRTECSCVSGAHLKCKQKTFTGIKVHISAIKAAWGQHNTQSHCHCIHYPFSVVHKNFKLIRKFILTIIHCEVFTFVKMAPKQSSYARHYNENVFLL